MINFMLTEQIKNLLNEFVKETLIYAVFSSPLSKDSAEKVTIKPLLIKNKPHFQWSSQVKQQVIHENLLVEDCLTRLEKILVDYKQAYFYTKTQDYHFLLNRKKEIKILKKAPTKTSLPLLTHNRQKKYLISDGDKVPFLIELGVMSPGGKVYSQKMDKFRQINRFLEMIQDILPHLSKDKPIHVVDFGCGKAYLTFALYHYLHIQLGYSVQMTGLDLKKEVILYCQKVADKLGFNHLKFSEGDISHYKTDKTVDMMVCLHACDTATDAALEKAVLWNTKVIMAVPCCQHELYNQVNNPALHTLLSHGILKERFAALATDAARAQLLEAVGYKTQIMEFIDLEHTPKNLLIRAIYQGKANPLKWEEYLKFKNHLQINPDLEKRLKPLIAS